MMYGYDDMIDNAISQNGISKIPSRLNDHTEMGRHTIPGHGKHVMKI